MIPIPRFNPHHKTGFQERFANQRYQRLLYDRQNEPVREERAPPEKSSAQIEEEENIQKLDDLVEGAQVYLFKAKTAIPLNPFPTEIIIDVNKVNVVTKEFFGSSHIHSIIIKDISDVIVETSPIFATLKIVDMGFTENSIDIAYLRRKDATKARKIIQGLIVAQKNGINLAQIDPEKICEKIENLGTVEKQV